jgi:hypothetical protein
MRTNAVCNSSVGPDNVIRHQLKRAQNQDYTITRQMDFMCAFLVVSNERINKRPFSIRCLAYVIWLEMIFEENKI